MKNKLKKGQLLLRKETLLNLSQSKNILAGDNALTLSKIKKPTYYSDGVKCFCF